MLTRWLALCALPQPRSLWADRRSPRDRLAALHARERRIRGGRALRQGTQTAIALRGCEALWAPLALRAAHALQAWRKAKRACLPAAAGNTRSPSGKERGGEARGACARPPLHS